MASRRKKYAKRRRNAEARKKSQSLHRMSVEHLEPKMLLTGPQIVGITPNSGELLQDGEIRHSAPEELTFRFDENQNIDANTLGGISVVRTDTGEAIQPGYIGLGESNNEVVLRFAESLEDAPYRINISGTGANALRNTSGEAFNQGANSSVGFELDLAPAITAVVPQPVTTMAGGLAQSRNQIQVHFNDDDLSAVAASQPRFYQLIYTADTISNTDDVIHLPTSVNYDASADMATLTFSSDLSNLSGEGTYRLRVGTDEALPAVPVVTETPEDVGNTFTTAHSLGTLGRADQLVRSAIDVVDYPLNFPGLPTEPGRVVLSVPTDEVPGITELEYNFQSIITIPSGDTFFNLITDAQKERAREMVDILADKAGVQFVETADSGITIGTATLPDTFEDIVAVPFSFNSDQFGDSWFMESMRQMVGQLTGEFTGQPDPTFPEDPTRDFAFISPVFVDPALPGAPTIDPLAAEALYPRNGTTLNLRHAYRPESNDIDVYRFNVPSGGVVQIEAIAERIGSNLNSAIRVYRDGGAQPTLIGQNDDYYGDDAALDLDLEPGSYFVTVTSSGLDYDPGDGNGLGGISQGDYELRVSFQPNVNNSLVDATGNALDGDGDGEAGGVFNYWFQARSAANTIYVDKTAGGTGRRGSLNFPFNQIDQAMSVAQPGDIVRIVGNGGADGNMSTLGDNVAYELGFNQFGTELPDGGALVVPKGVTTMIDAGAVFKLRQSSIQVGSSSVAIDRSGAAIQVLGTPDNSVVFTSYDDESIGIDTNPLSTTPDPGDWGGILIRNDLDRAESRFDYEQIGAFPNYINHADIRYGGGRVSISSVEQVIAPVHLVDARADVTYNTVTFSADAAISANPDSFEESRFHAVDSLGVDFQSELFTPDYARIGPDIHNNRLTENTINGLFVRINTIAAQRLERMTVSGRFDDLDIVHVIPENLIIEGEVGGPFREADGTMTPRLAAGLTIDPGAIVKLDGARIETTLGSRLYAEGREGRSIVFTSLLDDRFGAGGTFDTSHDPGAPDAGDWSGIYVAPTGHLSLDHAVVAYGGGLSRVEGSFAAFNAVEIHQADARLTNSIVEFSAVGRGGQADLDRPGRPDNAKGAIFVRNSPAVIVNNIVRDTQGLEAAAINIDINSLSDKLISDHGRATGKAEQITDYPDNQGALIRDNRLADNSLNGMEVRGGTVSQGTVFDDTDMVHIVFDPIEVPDFVSSGGLRLESSVDESLVVKLAGGKAGFVSSGNNLGDVRRIGGILQVIGQPGHPVVMTSLYDDTVGAGFDTSGQPLNQTSNFNRPLPSQPADSFQIDINYGPVMLAQPEFQKATELAARIWESMIEDPIRITIDVEFAALGPGTLGSTLNEIARLDFDTVIEELGADAGVRVHESIAKDLPFYEDFVADVTVPKDPANPFTISREMAVPMANAKALGFNPDAIPQTPSAYDPTETLDATIQMNNTYGVWDADRSDGISTHLIDFTGVMIHEMGHALGFVSTVDDVDAALGNPALSRDLELVPLDMFRMAPGAGAVDFENSPRVLDPRQTQVFYDGGFFDPNTPRKYAGINIPNIDRGDIPLSLGRGFGDGQQASHLKDDVALDGLELGMMDPTNPGPGREITVSYAERQAFDLIGWDVVGGAIPGDWRGVTLETLTHDRNVGIVIESESTDTSAIGNGLPSLAEFVGAIAPDTKSADENNRLGFTVQGLLNSDRDVDVYSFDAEAGTQIWFDIDNTHATLDTVVELIDANGQVFVRSDNSFAEAQGESELFSQGVLALTLPLSPEGGEDYWSTNVNDAGFRVFLPGASGTRNTYHVRVRSSSDNLNQLNGGESSGVYELQMRLQQDDWLPGTTVRYADIGYAVDGVRTRGLPANTPLASNVAEDSSPNDRLPFATFIEHNMLTAEPIRAEDRFANPLTANYWDLRRDPLNDIMPPFFPRTTDAVEMDFQEAQHVGHLTGGRYGGTTISGALVPQGGPDVDWYEFQVSGPTTLTMDMDYAAGIAGPNASIFVYEPFYRPAGNDEELYAARLIYSSKDGNDSDDGPAPLRGGNLDDLTRGSVSADDPLLGPIQLTPTALPTPAGNFRFLVAVTAGLHPYEFEQFTQAVAPADPLRITEPTGRGIPEPTPSPNNPFIRFEPSPSVIRVLEDTFEGDDPETSTIAVPHTLSDVPLFISTQTSLSLVNPFNGSAGGSVGNFDIPIGDFDIRAGLGNAQTDDWNFYAYSLGDNDANSGNYLVINPDDATMRGVEDDGGAGGGGGGGDTGFTDDGLVTSMLVPDPADPAAPPQVQASDTGVQYEAFEFFDATTGYAIGHRPDIGVFNILYQFNVARGNTLGSEVEEEFLAALPPAPAAISGITNIAERGVICVDPNDANCAGVADERDTDEVLSVLTDVVVGGELQIRDGQTITLDSGEVVELNMGPELIFNMGPGRFFTDGDTFTVNGRSYEVDTGQVLVVDDQTAIADGDTITLTGGGAFGTQQMTFEFDLNGDGVAAGRQAIAAATAASIVEAINASDIGIMASLVGNRISLQGEAAAAAIGVSNTNALQVEGAAGVSNQRMTRIALEETYTQAQVSHVLGNEFGADATVLNDRIVFPGGTADFQSLVDRGIATGSSASSDLENAGATEVEILPTDTKEDIAGKIAQAVGGRTLGSVVTLRRGTFTNSSDSGTLAIGGTNPGGVVTGMQFVDGQLYVVTSGGGLYTVAGFDAEAGGAPLVADYLPGSAAMAGAAFSGLTQGPATIEGGRYAQTLFATTASGDIHAFNTAGVPQEVFANGQSSISTGVGGANGLLFSPADENLWHVTDRKGPDPGHGRLDETGNRLPTDAGMSFHFGDANPDLTENRNYNFPGGSHGSLITDAMSLEGFTAADQPTVYFNYLLSSDASTGGDDSFRVFVSDEAAEDGRGEWVLLASNQAADVSPVVKQLFDNTWEDQAELYPEDPQPPSDEAFGLRRNGRRDPYTENRSRQTGDGLPQVPPPLPVPSEEATIWRRARLDLSAFAGSSNLRLRFDFSSAGGFGLGAGSGGIELRALGGDRLADGDQFVIDGQTFEFERGLELSVPSGAQIADGEMLLLDGTNDDAAIRFLQQPATDKAIYVSPSLAPADRQGFQLLLNGETTRFEFDNNGSSGGVAVSLDGGRLIDSLVAAINGENLPFTASADGNVLLLSNPDVTLNVASSGLVDVQSVVYGTEMTPNEVASSVTAVVNGGGGTITAVQAGRTLTMQGVQSVERTAGSRFVSQGTAGQNAAGQDVHLVSIDASMTSAEVAEQIAGAIADVFANGNADVVKQYENIVYVHGRNAINPGPLGMADQLPGDAGHLYAPGRGLDNQLQYVIGDIDDSGGGGGGGGGNDGALFDETGNNFVVPFEGVYVDDLIVGFASRGEKVVDHRLGAVDLLGMSPSLDPLARSPVRRPQTQRLRGTTNDQQRNDINGRPPALGDEQGNAPDDQADSIWDGDEQVVMVDRSHLPPEPPTFVPDPDFVGSAAGPYQLEIRVGSGEIRARLAEGDLLDPRERLATSTTLFARAGMDVLDGQIVELTDGNNHITLEYEDVALGNGVADGNIAIPFNVDDTATVMAGIIRDVINNTPAIRSAIGITAIGTGGSLVGEAPTNAIQLHGPVIYVSDESSIDFEITVANDSSNIDVTQGQVLIESNRIMHSQMFGVTTEAGYRANPAPERMDPEGLNVHFPPLIGDFQTGLGAARNLITPNIQNQLPSVVVSNNIIARGGAGGIHASGDAGGFMITAPIGGEANAAEVWDNGPFIFAIADYKGNSALFEFDADGVVSGANVIPVPIVNNPQECPLPTACSPRNGVGPNMSAALSQAISGAGLDVTVHQYNDGGPTARTLFVEGASAVVGTNVLGVPGINWFAPWVSQMGGVRTYSRIVNNTIVGAGGQMSDNTQQTLDIFNPAPGTDTTKVELINDYEDVGILIDNFAYPAVINNLTVNTEYGIQADVTTNDSVIGGNLFQHNVQDTEGINVGDFPIVLDPQEPLFVDIANDNFYLAPETRAIDSSIDSLEDRPELVSVKEPVGIPRSNVLSPSRDVLGQLREDDPNVETPSGLGQNVFKDRGAVDRVDFVGPTVSLANPRDNDPAGVDKNTAPTVVSLESTVLTNFTLQFSDSQGVGQGTGIDPNTVTSSAVILRQDGRVLEDGLDYIFSYDSTNSVIRMTPIAGVWPNGSSYQLQLLPSIKDLAGNALAANQPSGATTFLIATAAGSDYGDAPQPYPTTLADNGPLHNLVPGVFLGTTVTQDEDGQPNAAAAGDGGDDGVTFPAIVERDAQNTITVRASVAGRLDGWLDFNQDGDWTDSGEQIFTGVQLNAGENTLQVNIPGNAATGDTFARFRFSTAGGLSFTGPAADGEVEDYQVTIDPGSIWQNPVNQLDTSNDGFVSAIDVLRIIQEVNNRRASDANTGLLTVPPAANLTPAELGFVDVNGDGFATPIDALAVIRAINQQGNGAGEPDEARMAAAMGPLTVDPIGEVLQNPIVELPSLDAKPDASVDAALADTDWLDLL